MKLFIIVAYFLLRIYHSAAIELLVLPDGEEHSILCTAIITEEEDSYQINWAANGRSIGDGFVVGEEETLDDGTRERNITFTATNDINNTNLSCVVSHLFEPSNTFRPIQLTIIIQG